MDERPDIVENIRWFSRLTLTQRIRVIEEHGEFLRRLRALRPVPHVPAFVQPIPSAR